MEEISTRLKKRYLVFIASIVLTLVVSQVIIQYDLHQQNQDAELINLAGRQRMLSQRISKLTLFLFYNQNIELISGSYSLDTLRTLTQNWKSTHELLIQQNSNGPQSKTIDSLLLLNSPRINQIERAAQQILANPQAETIQKAIQQIAEVELPYLLTMEHTVGQYQKEAEAKLTNLKRVEYLLAVLGLIILVLEFVYIFYPTLMRVANQNKLLSELNNQLQTREKDLQQSLAHVQSLKDNLTQSERQYRELVMNASDMIYELNEIGKFSFVNPGVESITGYGRDELLTKTYAEVIHPDDRKTAIEFYQQQVATFNKNSYQEFRIKTKSGKDVWIGQNVKIQFAGKTAYRVNVVARNITKIKEAELRLYRERLLLRTIIDNIPVNIYVKNLQSQKILANKAEYEYLGAKTEAEILGKSDIELYPSESAALSIAEDKRVFTGESIVNVETLNMRKDGSQCWFLISKVPLRDENQNIIGLVGISIDITESKLAREEVARKEKLYRLVSENSHDVVSLHKLDGTFEYISSACLDLHGYSPEEMIGRLGTDFIYAEDAAKILSSVGHLQDKMQNRESIEPMQFRIATKHRGLVWVENVIKPVYTNNELTGFQSTVRDISARKLYEAALQEAKEKAENATKVKSQFLSMMSHEIRTPINGILGLTNLMLAENPREDQLQRLSLLKFSGENLLSIINDVLDFSKAEAGKIILETIPFDLHEVARNVINILTLKANEKQIELSVSLDSKLPRYFAGDSVRLTQVLNNLVNNAIKFTEVGSVNVEIKSVQIGSHTHTIQFSITDTGIGIPSNKLNTIFESFTQANSDTTRKYGGTGLGLAITKNLVELMGGQLQVKSKMGEGSTFSFEVVMQEAFIESVPISNLNTASNSLRILVVDDNPVNQEVAAGFLKKWGHTVTLADGGKEAIEKIKTKKFDLVLMDLQMPAIDGYQATDSIRQLSESYFKSVPIVALTASASTEVQQRITDHGMNGYLSKPFKPEDLKSIVDRYSKIQGEQIKNSTTLKSIDEYTEGNVELKKQLIVLFKDNLVEIRQKFFEALEKNNPDLFLGSLHKAITTIRMIDSVELTSTLDEIRDLVKVEQKIPVHKSELITTQIDRVIALLDDELLK
ncbi:MAG: PAS domain S-box protein [Cyclobacteriaceae bacterium]|nr:PAS domain S-box protein [Cyclobacteriaceae bacterium]